MICVRVFNNSRIKPSEDIDKINQVVLDVISKNISALVQTDQYGAINTTYMKYI